MNDDFSLLNFQKLRDENIMLCRKIELLNKKISRLTSNPQVEEELSNVTDSIHALFPTNKHRHSKNKKNLQRC